MFAEWSGTTSQSAITRMCVCRWLLRALRDPNQYAWPHNLFVRLQNVLVRVQCGPTEWLPNNCTHTVLHFNATQHNTIMRLFCMLTCSSMKAKKTVQIRHSLALESKHIDKPLAGRRLVNWEMNGIINECFCDWQLYARMMRAYFCDAIVS